MTAVTLVLMTLAAAAAVAPARTRLPHWAMALTSALLLGLAAVVGANSSPAQGVALGATYVVTVLAAVVGGSTVVTAVFRLARRDNGPGPDPAAPDSEAPDTEASAGPLHGGRTIGVLERTAVAASILAGWPEGIAVVLAVKGLARYPELRGSDTSGAAAPTTQVSSASEQFIIGTFTSVMWAVAVCGIGHGLVS